MGEKRVWGKVGVAGAGREESEEGSFEGGSRRVGVELGEAGKRTGVGESLGVFPPEGRQGTRPGRESKVDGPVPHGKSPE